MGGAGAIRVGAPESRPSDGGPYPTAGTGDPLGATRDGVSRAGRCSSTRTRVDRLASVATWVAFAVVLIGAVRAPVLRTGDAHQYHAMGAAFARLGPPSLAPNEVAAYMGWLTAQPPASSFPAAVRAIDQPNLVAGGRQEFSHFWLYPLLASPLVAAASGLGFHPGYAFLALNALLLGASLRLVVAVARPTLGLLLLATPIVWFVSKAQVEVFTFACLTVAMALALRGRFVLAALAAAVAATQNLPIAAAIPLFWAAGLVQAWRAEPSRMPRNGQPSWRTSAIVGLTVLVAALHPAYYLWRLGVVTPQQLNGGIGPHVPSFGRLLAVAVDPDIGLLAWAPQLGVVAGVGLVALLSPRAARSGIAAGNGWSSTDLVRHGPRLSTARLAAAVGLLAGAWFLVAFAQTTNANSGGTVHVSRYALWLVPLLVPMLAAVAARSESANAAVLAVGLVAFPVALVLFQPAQPERYVEPSPQSAWLTEHLPGLYLPIPEVFYERHRATDGGVRGSAADASCRVILLYAADRRQPCPLDADESTAADALFAAGWQAAWVVRPSERGLGRPGVGGAMPPAAPPAGLP